MNNIERINYWKRFNVVMRIFGFIFFVSGLIPFILWVIKMLKFKTSVAVSPDDDFMNVFVPLVFALVGFLAMKLEPYFPADIKKQMLEKKLN